MRWGRLKSALASIRAHWSGRRRKRPSSLERHYSLALAMVACLTIVSQYLLQQGLALHRKQTVVIELIGQERDFCHRAARTAQEIQLAANDGELLLAINDLREAIDAWEGQRRRLYPSLSDNPAIRAHFEGENTNRVAVAAGALLRTYDQLPVAMRRDVLRQCAKALLAIEPAMNRQIEALGAEAKDHLLVKELRLSQLAFVLVAATLLVLVLQGSLVFRRAMSAIGRLTEDRHRLVEEARQADAVALDMVVALRATEAQLKKLASVAGATENLVVIADAAGRIEWVNAAFTRITQYEADEAVGRPVEAVLRDQRDDPITLARLRRHRAAAADVWEELAMLGCDGGVRWMAFDLQAICDAAGQIKSHIVVGTDLTDRRAAEQTLAESARERKLILDSVADGICMVDAAGQVTFANPSAARMVGSSAEELNGLPHHDAMGHAQPDGTPFERESCPICRQLAANRWHQNQTAVFCRRDGSRFAVEYNCAPLAEGDRQGGSVITFRDVTERNNLQRQLLQTQKLESIGQLAAGIAHEINAPIQYVGDNIRQLQDAIARVEPLLELADELLTASQQEQPPVELADRMRRLAKQVDSRWFAREVPNMIEQSIEGTQRVATIVEAMRNFSQPSSGAHVPTDLNRAIASTITVARHEWKHIAEVMTDFDANLPPISCVPGELNQVVLNLLVNAAQAIVEATQGRGKGQIVISTRRDGAWAEIRVADTGTGIAEHIRSRVFDPFFTTKAGKGAGQGLALAYASVVEHHGGTIGFETKPGVGTTFIVRLPLASPVAGETNSQSYLVESFSPIG
jgi:PAS domain S-box-containing protein